MRLSFAICAITACGLLATASPTLAQTRCFPINSDVVSLGETNARSYASASLERNIKEQETLMKVTGFVVTGVTRNELECAPFPNVLGIDEWRCTGAARVCARSAP
jgi:hypothetical protein